MTSECSTHQTAFPTRPTHPLPQPSAYPPTPPTLDQFQLSYNRCLAPLGGLMLVAPQRQKQRQRQRQTDRRTDGRMEGRTDCNNLSTICSVHTLAILASSFVQAAAACPPYCTMRPVGFPGDNPIYCRYCMLYVNGWAQYWHHVGGLMHRFNLEIARQASEEQQQREYEEDRREERR